MNLSIPFHFMLFSSVSSDIEDDLTELGQRYHTAYMYEEFLSWGM